MFNLLSGLQNLPWLDQEINKLLELENGGYALFTLVTVVFSVLISGIIGFERERKGHSAGLRTHIMVSIGSSLIMVVSVIGTKINGGDPFRLAAQVVSGIGFLGAGTIMQTSTNIKGLTTASTLWLCGGIGLACGAGFVSESLIVGAIALIVLLLLGLLERKSSKYYPKVVMIVNAETPTLKTALEIADKYDCYVTDVSSNMITYRQKNCLKIIISFERKLSYFKLKAFADELKEKVSPYEMKITSVESYIKAAKAKRKLDKEINNNSNQSNNSGNMQK